MNPAPDLSNVPLGAAQDVRDGAEGRIALSNTPWLALPSGALEPGRFVEIRYSASLYDAPVRPLLRFWRADRNFREVILPAPTEGAALWLGRVPKDCVETWVSPTNRVGPFSFRIDHIRPAPLSALLARALRAPKRTFFALSAGVVGLADEADLNWRFALGSEPLAHYPAWRAARWRDVDPALDRPRGDWREKVAVVIYSRGASDDMVARTRASIEAQNYQDWRVAFFDGDKAPSLNDCAFAMLLRAGDILEPRALACFVEFFARHPDCKIAYADDASSGAPDFKPGWSPTLHAYRNYVGRAACLRAALLADAEWKEQDPEALIDRLLSNCGPGEVRALHRLLLHLARSGVCVRPGGSAPIHRDASPTVSIVIPTRDRADLLESCLDGLLQKTAYPRYDVIIIDNDSVEPRTRALFERLRADARIKILPRPGAFNFSALCNDGARETRGDYLVFLNNDTEIVAPDWIERLLLFAARPDIGAVGAKLLYPNSLVQHVGVLLGMGGVAGHFGAGLDEAAPGWQGRSLAPHEVSAVTAACLMVSRTKFETIGGFDAEHLPVELNDVDLCLRLAAHGWRAVANPEALLIHRQSASRGGGALRLQRVYETERAFFLDRWRAIIRDDPYFHPGLSLYAPDARLP